MSRTVLAVLVLSVHPAAAALAAAPSNDDFAAAAVLGVAARSLTCARHVGHREGGRAGRHQRGTVGGLDRALRITLRVAVTPPGKARSANKRTVPLKRNSGGV
jgi:hypothetical protein